MKILGWMQSRLKQSTLSLKDCSFGYSCTCLCLQPQRADSLVNQSHGRWKSKRQKPFSKTESKEGEEKVSGLFDGLLAIGTLDLNKVVPDPSTPTLEIPEQNPVENKKEETEKTWGKEETGERKEEIENVFMGTKLNVVEEEEEGTDIPEEEEKWISLNEVVGEGGEGRRTSVNEGNRMSLGEFLEKTVMEDIKNKSAVGKLEAEYIKKKSKRRIPDFSKNKLSKMMRILNKKVHLGSLTSTVKVEKKNKNNKRTASVTVNCPGAMGTQILPDEDLMIILQKSKIKDVISWQNGYSTQLSHKIDSSKEGREYWIKTDADYLVLEL